MAGGSRADLWSGEEHLPAAQAGAGHAREAPGDRRRSHGRRAVIGSLGTTEHCFYRAGESHCPSWGSSLGTSHVGHGEARPTAASPSRMVASFLSCCATPSIVTGGVRSATRTRGQTSGTTRPPAHSSYGSWKNQPALDSAGGAVPSSAAGAMRNNLRVNGREKTPAKER